MYKPSNTKNNQLGCHILKINTSMLIIWVRSPLPPFSVEIGASIVWVFTFPRKFLGHSEFFRSQKPTRRIVDSTTYHRSTGQMLFRVEEGKYIFPRVRGRSSGETTDSVCVCIHRIETSERSSPDPAFVPAVLQLLCALRTFSTAPP